MISFPVGPNWSYERESEGVWRVLRDDVRNDEVREHVGYVVNIGPCSGDTLKVSRFRARSLAGSWVGPIETSGPKAALDHLVRTLGGYPYL